MGLCIGPITWLEHEVMGPFNMFCPLEFELGPEGGPGGPGGPDPLGPNIGGPLWLETGGGGPPPYMGPAALDTGGGPYMLLGWP